MTYLKAKVSPSGRISLPAEFRKAVGLQSGGDVIVELADNEIRIRTMQQSVRRAQAMARKLLGDRPGGSVDDFLAEKRRDAKQEEREMNRLIGRWKRPRS